MHLTYNSRRYALLNRPIEVERHFGRVLRHLRPRRTDRLLEIGCGRGFLTERVRRWSPCTLGVDLNPEAIANSVAGGLRVMDAQRLDLEDEQFDGVYSFHAIEHIPDVPRVLMEMERVLKPGGRLLLVYPAEPIRGLYVVPTALILFRNPLRARDLHLHALTPAKIRRLLRHTTLEHVTSRLALLLTPQFITLLRKPMPLRLRASSDAATTTNESILAP